MLLDNAYRQAHSLNEDLHCVGAISVLTSGAEPLTAEEVKVQLKAHLWDWLDHTGQDQRKATDKASAESPDTPMWSALIMPQLMHIQLVMDVPHHCASTMNCSRGPV